MLITTIHQDPLPTSLAEQGISFPWYNAARSIAPTAAGNLPALNLGEYWEVASGVPAQGNRFQYLHLDLATVDGETVTYAAGVLLTFATPGTDTVAAVLTDGGVAYGVTLTTGGLTANAEVGNWIYFSDISFLAPIKGNTAANVIVSLKTSLVGNQKYDADQLPTSPALSSPVSIIRPWHVTLCGSGGVPTHVLLNDTLTGQRIVAQNKGYAMCLSNNTGAALVAGTPAIPAASGLLTGGSATGRARIIPLVAYNSATNTLVPCDIDLD